MPEARNPMTAIKSRNSKPETRNPKLETTEIESRNSKPDNRNRNLEPETQQRKPKLETETRQWKPETQNPKLKPETRQRKPETGNPKPKPGWSGYRSSSGILRLGGLQNLQPSRFRAKRAQLHRVTWKPGPESRLDWCISVGRGDDHHGSGRGRRH